MDNFDINIDNYNFKDINYFDTKEVKKTSEELLKKPGIFEAMSLLSQQ
ncbi:hypothetical protein ACJQWY_01410 [Weissella kandleri]